MPGLANQPLVIPLGAGQDWATGLLGSQAEGKNKKERKKAVHSLTPILSAQTVPPCQLFGGVTF